MAIRLLNAIGEAALERIFAEEALERIFAEGATYRAAMARGETAQQLHVVNALYNIGIIIDNIGIIIADYREASEDHKLLLSVARRMALSGEFYYGKYDGDHTTVRLEKGKLHCSNDWARESRSVSCGQAVVERHWYLNDKALAYESTKGNSVVRLAYDSTEDELRPVETIDLRSLGFEIDQPPTQPSRPLEKGSSAAPAAAAPKT